ncbi:MAG: nuclear transport factor 2 family protein [Myxococcota bacterium]|jgi:hypothetical protein|nr:nuclear transport factor 2 family protein [Myxococcota bacterium]
MDLDQLLAEREIYRQLVRFARAMDERDWSAIEALTTPDIEADVGLGLETGRDIRTLGLYRDAWQKVDGRWLICRRIKQNRDTIGSMDVFRPEKTPPA